MCIPLLTVPSVHFPFFGSMAKSIRPEQAIFLIDEQGINVNATDSENWTPSHFACAYGNSGLLNTLLERGALPEAQTEGGWRPLHFAAQGGYLSCIELLVDYKARVTCATKECRSTPLHLAANSGLEVVCERLLNEGADSEARDMLERTPLQLAAEQGHLGAVRALLDGGAEVFVSDHDKWVPRQIAEFHGFMEVADVLAKAEEKGNRGMFGGSLYLPTDSWKNVEIFAQVREDVARQRKLRSIDAERDAAYARCVDAYKNMVAGS